MNSTTDLLASKSSTSASHTDTSSSTSGPDVSSSNAISEFFSTGSSTSPVSSDVSPGVSSTSTVLFSVSSAVSSSSLTPSPLATEGSSEGISTANVSSTLSSTLSTSLPVSSLHPLTTTLGFSPSAPTPASTSSLETTPPLSALIPASTMDLSTPPPSLISPLIATLSTEQTSAPIPLTSAIRTDRSATTSVNNASSMITEKSKSETTMVTDTTVYGVDANGSTRSSTVSSAMELKSESSIQTKNGPISSSSKTTEDAVTGAFGERTTTNVTLGIVFSDEETSSPQSEGMGRSSTKSTTTAGRSSTNLQSGNVRETSETPFQSASVYQEGNTSGTQSSTRTFTASKGTTKPTVDSGTTTLESTSTSTSSTAANQAMTEKNRSTTISSNAGMQTTAVADNTTANAHIIPHKTTTVTNLDDGLDSKHPRSTSTVSNVASSVSPDSSHDSSTSAHNNQSAMSGLPVHSTTTAASFDDAGDAYIKHPKTTTMSSSAAPQAPNPSNSSTYNAPDQPTPITASIPTTPIDEEASGNHAKKHTITTTEDPEDTWVEPTEPPKSNQSSVLFFQSVLRVAAADHLDKAAIDDASKSLNALLNLNSTKDLTKEDSPSDTIAKVTVLDSILNNSVSENLVNKAASNSLLNLATSTDLLQAVADLGISSFDEFMAEDVGLIVNSSQLENVKQLFNVMEKQYDQTALSSTMQDMLPFFMSNLPEDVLIKAGYNASEIIMRCVYNGVRCDIEKFQLKLDPTYGNCYTFNAEGDYYPASRAGASTGLTVTLFIGDQDYLHHIDSAGMRVMVHLQNDPVFPDIMGVSVPGGYQSSLAIRKYQLNAISTRKRSCAHSPADVKSFIYNTSYTVKGCQRSCAQMKVIEHCGCGDPAIQLPKKTSYRHCNLTSRACVNQVQDNISLAKSDCYCPVECSGYDFFITQTTKKYPPFQNHQLRQDFLKHYRHSTDDDISQFVVVEVYFDDQIVVEYTEIIPYQIDQFLYDVSGILGVFTGMTVITMCEIATVMTWAHKKSHGLYKKYRN